MDEPLAKHPHLAERRDEQIVVGQDPQQHVGFAAVHKREQTVDTLKLVEKTGVQLMLENERARERENEKAGERESERP